MKATFLILLATLSLNNVHAAARAFRIENVSSDNYATAYGFKGELVDFEQVERTDNAWEFMESRWEAGTFCNYVVDIRNDQILSESCGDFIDASFGGFSVGNHYSYNLDVASVRVEPSDWSADYSLLIESSSMKWNGGISTLLVSKRAVGNTEIVDSCDYTCVESVMQEIYSKLSSEHRTLMDDLGANYFDISEVELADYSKAIKFENTFYRPKSEDTEELKVTSLLKAKLIDSKLVIEVVEVKAEVLK